MTAAKAASTSKKAAETKVAKKPATSAPKKVETPVQEKKAAPVRAKKEHPATPKRGTPVSHGVGRRKAAVARVWLRRAGSGVITVNQLPIAEYFDTEVARRSAQISLSVVPAVATRYDIDVNVVGGGKHGQADAVKLAIARALVKADDSVRPAMKAEGFLSVDERKVERKKPGQRKARRKFQFVKR